MLRDRGCMNHLGKQKQPNGSSVGRLERRKCRSCRIYSRYFALGYHFHRSDAPHGSGAFITALYVSFLFRSWSGWRVTLRRLTILLPVSQLFYQVCLLPVSPLFLRQNMVRMRYLRRNAWYCRRCFHDHRTGLVHVPGIEIRYHKARNNSLYAE